MWKTHFNIAGQMERENDLQLQSSVAQMRIGELS